jgi:glutamate synthase (NADPH) small chain
VVGSGPAGLACAQQLARAGHDVTVFEKSDRIGGLLRYGIPDFKMEKPDRPPHRADGGRRRQFRTKVVVGDKCRPASTTMPANVSAEQLKKDFDAVILAGGSEVPRDLPVPGRELKRRAFRAGIPDSAEQGSRGRQEPDQRQGQARGGHRRRRYRLRLRRHLQPPRRASVTQFELMPMPPEQENKPLTWPYWPSSCAPRRRTTKAAARLRRGHQGFIGENGNVTGLKARPPGLEGRQDERSPGSEFEMKADARASWRWASPARSAGLLDAFGVEKDARGNAKATPTAKRLLPDQRRQGVRRRRRAPRPVAGGLGDPRRPPVRARGG